MPLTVQVLLSVDIAEVFKDAQLVVLASFVANSEVVQLLDTFRRDNDVANACEIGGENLFKRKWKGFLHGWLFVAIATGWCREERALVDLGHFVSAGYTAVSV